MNPLKTTFEFRPTFSPPAFSFPVNTTSDLRSAFAPNITFFFGAPGWGLSFLSIPFLSGLGRGQTEAEACTRWELDGGELALRTNGLGTGKIPAAGTLLSHLLVFVKKVNENSQTHKYWLQNQTPGEAEFQYDRIENETEV